MLKIFITDASVLVVLSFLNPQQWNKISSFCNNLWRFLTPVVNFLPPFTCTCLYFILSFTGSVASSIVSLCWIRHFTTNLSDTSNHAVCKSSLNADLVIFMDNELHLMNSYTAIPCDEDIQAQAIYILKTMLNIYGMSSKILSLEHVNVITRKLQWGLKENNLIDKSLIIAKNNPKI